VNPHPSAVLGLPRYVGVGTELSPRLLAIGSNERLREIVANILPENIAMQALANHFGFTIRGTLSSLGVYSDTLSLPLEPFAEGPGDHKIITTLCPGAKERMRRLMELTFSLDRIMDAYKVFGERRDGVIRVAIMP
jgi:hypothetical protein